MTFEWDPRKSAENVDRRGFDFAFATLVFDGITVECEDTRHPYGERRRIALGLADGIPLTVVFTDRLRSDGTPARRIISARVSSRAERRRHAQEVAAHQAEPRKG